MVNYWLDANSFITPKTYYHIAIVPGFWDLLDQHAERGLASPEAVYDEVAKGNDEVATWAKARKTSPLWVIPDAAVQAAYRSVADHVQATYQHHLVADFLRGADAWLIAFATACGGKLVTFETRRYHAVAKLKIPSVGDHFHVKSVDLFTMMRELAVKLQLQ